MTTRPLLRYRIVQLEEMFAAQPSATYILKELNGELQSATFPMPRLCCEESHVVPIIASAKFHSPKFIRHHSTILWLEESAATRTATNENDPSGGEVITLVGHFFLVPGGGVEPP